jgi:hypothetical protein
MTQLMNLMVGFSTSICQHIKLWISVLLLLNCIALVSAQTDTDIRVEWAAQYGDGTVVVHVSTPRGTAIDSAQIRTNDANLNLSAPPIAMDTVHWLVLDASQDMVNIGESVQNGLMNLVRSFAGQAFGVITYGNGITVVLPSAAMTTIETALENYDPQDNPTGCVYDALAALANIPHSATKAWRVLLISSSISSQVDCDKRRFEDLGLPIDVLAIGSQDTSALRLLADETQGEFRNSNIYQIQASWNAIDSQWSRPIYRLSSRSGAHINREGDLIVTLTNGQQATINIDVLSFDDILPDGSEYIPPTPIPPTNTPFPTATSIPPTATATDIATNTPIPTATDSIASVPLIAATEVNPSASPVLPTNSPEPAPTLIRVSPQPTLETPAIIPDTNATLVNNVIIIVGGIAVGLVIIFVIYNIVQNSAEEIAAHSKLAQSGIEISSKTPLPPLNANFYDVQTEASAFPQPVVEVKPPTDTDKLDNTEMEDGEGDDGTQVWSIEDLQEAIRMPTVATLMADVDETLYDISGPRTLLGSGTMCQIRFSDFAMIAEEHILFDIDDDNKVTATILTDHTVYINGKRLLHTRQLQSGDEIQLAPDMKMIFNYLED